MPPAGRPGDEQAGPLEGRFEGDPPRPVRRHPRAAEVGLVLGRVRAVAGAHHLLGGHGLALAPQQGRTARVEGRTGPAGTATGTAHSTLAKSNVRQCSGLHPDGDGVGGRRVVVDVPLAQLGPEVARGQLHGIVARRADGGRALDAHVLVGSGLGLDGQREAARGRDEPTLDRGRVHAQQHVAVVVDEVPDGQGERPPAGFVDRHDRHVLVPEEPVSFVLGHRSIGHGTSQPGTVAFAAVRPGGRSSVIVVTDRYRDRVR